MIKPRKRFGQHFLNDQTVIAQILDVFSPTSSDHIVEIGPGQGALTYPLLKRITHLGVIEVDRDLAYLLKKNTENQGNLTVHCQDVLTFNFETIKQDDRLLRIIGNLPYNISTPLIFHLLSYAHLISDMVFMLQKEVAHRMAAKPSTPDYGRLSVMTQYYCEAVCLFNVPPDAFFPPPKVDSTIILLKPYQQKPCVARDEKILGQVVATAFNQRRKTLKNSLKRLIDPDKWDTINVSSDLRPENLTVEDFVAISHLLTEKSS